VEFIVYDTINIHQTVVMSYWSYGGGEKRQFCICQKNVVADMFDN
jgi:hypothetical protein